MADRLSQITVKMQHENGVMVADEEVSCLRSAKTPGAFQGLRQRLMTDSRLGARAKVGIVFLVLLLLILLLAVIIMGFAWPKNNARHICKTSNCLALAADVAKKRDHNWMACADVWKWSCGGWLEENAARIPARAHWNLADETKYTVMRRFRDTITKMTSLGGPDTINWKLKSLYDSCMNVDNIESEGSVLLKKKINGLGGWHVLRDFWTSRNFDGPRTLELVQTRYGAKPLFDVSVISEADGTPAVLLSPGTFGLPDPSFYFAGFKTSAVIAYKRLLQDTTQLLGATSANARIFADDVLNYERRLTELLLENEESNITSVTLKELADAQWLPIKSILTAMFSQATFTNNTKIYLQAPKYMSHLNSILYGADRGILNDYLIWQVTRLYLPYLSSEYQSVWQAFQTDITGAKNQLSRWEFCANTVYDFAPLAMIGLLEKEYQETNDKQTFINTALEDIFLTAKATVIEIITDSDKLGEDKKEQLIDKVSTLNMRIGLLYEIDESALEAYHSKLFVQVGSFFENIGPAFDFRRSILHDSFFDKKFNQKRTLLEALSGVTIKYDLSSHTIAVPKIITTLPYYNPFHPRSVQYARIGVPLVQEMLKSLLYHEEVTQKNSISKKTQACIANALETFAPVNDSYITLSSATGMLHMTAVDIAIKAMKVHLQGSNSLVEDCRGVGLPTFEEFDETKLFALVYAQTQCSMITEQQTILNFINGQLDGKKLIQVTWMHIKEFTDSFNCQRFPTCTTIF